MENNARRVLVTGANGFIGRHLCRYLQGCGKRVRALVRSLPVDPGSPGGKECWDEAIACRLGEEPIADEALADIDTVFHLAGVAHSFRPARELEKFYWTVNTEATAALVHKAGRAGVRRFVYVSSVKAMADPGERCVDESWDALPADVYGLSKRRAEEAVLAAGRASSMHVCNLRPALVYGPGVKGNLLQMMQAVEAGRFPPLAEAGNKRAMVHVDDLIQAAMLAVENSTANGRTYIVTDDRLYSTREMYVAMCAALGKRLPFWTVPNWILRGAGYCGDLLGRLSGRRMPVNTEAIDRLLGSACYCCDRIRKDLDYRPQRSFAATLPEMISFYRKTSGNS